MNNKAFLFFVLNFLLGSLYGMERPERGSETKEGAVISLLISLCADTLLQESRKDPRAIVDALRPFEHPDHTSCVEMRKGLLATKNLKKKAYDYWSSMILEGNCSGAINAVAHSPWGRIIAFGGGTTFVIGENYNTIKIWDISTGECVNQLAGHYKSVKSIDYSRCGRSIVSGSADKTVRIWDVASGKCSSVFEGHTKDINSVKFSPCDLNVASAGYDGTVKIWDAVTGKCIKIINDGGMVNSVAYSQCGRNIAVGSFASVAIWDVATGNCIKELAGHDKSINSIEYYSVNKLASASSDGTIRIWDVAAGSCINILKGHVDGVTSVSYNLDGRAIVSGSDDKTVRIWDVVTGECLNVLEGHKYRVNSVSCSPDGSIASASSDETLRIWGGLGTLPPHRLVLADYYYNQAENPMLDPELADGYNKVLPVQKIDINKSLRKRNKGK